MNGRKVLFATPFLQLVEIACEIGGEKKKWFGVTRTNAVAAVVIAALTDTNELILVKQPRPMVGEEMIELPAGLMDISGESVLQTAERELLEETGYNARTMRLLVGGPRGLTVSSGITDERLYLVLAEGAEKVCEPLENEGTKPILVPLHKAFDWLHLQVREGKEVDYKLFGGICLIEKEVRHGDQG